MAKTSFARELGRRPEDNDCVFLFADAKGATRAEDVIVDVAQAAHPVRKASSKMATFVGRWLRDSVAEVRAYEFRLKLRAGLDSGNCKRFGEQMFSDCADHHQPVLVVRDALPLFLNRMLRLDGGLVSLMNS